MQGINGNILRADLTAGKLTVQTFSDDHYRRHLGGRGIIAHTLLTEVPPGIDPFGPENRLIFALGTLTGHPFVGSGRNSVGCKSPLTGGYGESEAGGFWGAELKKAGFEAVVIEGISPKPVYLQIKDGEAEIRDADRLWGLETADTDRAIREELGDRRIRTAVIGPSGEKLVRFACISNDITHVAGRTGMGAVMGSKRLKAIAVRGSHLPEAADPEKLRELNRWMLKNYKEKSKQWRYGTGSDMRGYEANGNMPVRNFQGGRFPGVEKINAQLLCEKYVEKMDHCYGCPIRCKRVVKLQGHFAVDPVYGGPEYETLAAFGSNCGIDDLEALMKAHELCNRYGIDTISTGVAISFAMECVEKGILSREDTDGLDLTFGNAEAMVRMVEQIALRRGLGDLLAEGTRRAAEKIGRGSEAFAMQVKGQELPMHEPRYKQAMGLHYSIHATGADHGTGIHDTEAMAGETGAKLYEKSSSGHLANTLGMCKFVPWSDAQTREAVAYVTGWPATERELMQVVDRGIILARIFNIRDGFSDKDDVLPKRFAETPSGGPLKGINPEAIGEARKTYYRMMGWDEAGMPTLARLAELGIGWASRYLSR
ncbi:MAG: aldehyde ferredoxin oxidoreductase family protein [Deltaproteobacteria bacterium]|nr:aldehyde ferredoxin oxidoreductase family protein [Deltaproteobacteria bacterium]